jgi:hypothetical protein
MTRYIQFETEEDGTILIEVEEGEEDVTCRGGVTKAARPGRIEETVIRVQGTFEDALDVVRHNADVFIRKLRGLSDPPDEVEVTFGLKAMGEVGNFAVAKASAEANYAVKLTWKREQEE